MVQQTKLEDDEFGASNPSGTPVGVASGIILQSRRLRKSLHLVNDSPNIIYLSKRDPAALNAGIRLNPAGGQYWEPDARGKVWKGPWYAIATVAASNLCTTEDW